MYYEIKGTEPSNSSEICHASNSISVKFFETIPGPVATKTAVLAISICMNKAGDYYSKEAFAAIADTLLLREFEKIELLFPGELEGYSIAMEQGKPAIDQEIKNQARKATADWIEANIESLAKIVAYNNAEEKTNYKELVKFARIAVEKWLKNYRNSIRSSSSLSDTESSSGLSDTESSSDLSYTRSFSDLSGTQSFSDLSDIESSSDLSDAESSLDLYGTKSFPAVTLYTYEQIMSTPEYAVASQLINYARKHSEHNKYFNNEINKDADSYRKRRGEKSSDPNIRENYKAESSKQLAIEYRHVELAGFLYFTLNKEIKAGAFLYPSQPATSFKALNKVVIQPLSSNGIPIKNNNEEKELITLPYPLIWCGLKVENPALDKNKKQQPNLFSSSSNPDLTSIRNSSSSSSREGSPRSSLDSRRGSNLHSLPKLKTNQSTNTEIDPVEEDHLSPNTLKKQLVLLKQEQKANKTQMSLLQQQIEELTSTQHKIMSGLVSSQQKKEENPIGNYNSTQSSCWEIFSNFPRHLYTLYNVLINDCYCPQKKRRRPSNGIFSSTIPSSSQSEIYLGQRRRSSPDTQYDSNYPPSP